MFKLKQLHELIVPWISGINVKIPYLTGLELDSRNINFGNLFIAIQGYNTDGRLHIDDAINNGAVAILSESYNKSTFFIKKIVNNVEVIPIIYFNQLNKCISNIAGRFYDHPSLCLKLIGVTGTNGKTTITHLLTNWTSLLGERSAVMGTLGNGVLSDINPSCCTTCSAIETQKILKQFVQSGVTFVAMEISSHGLDQYRVDSLYFDVAIFSNISNDHLDYHNNINQYRMAKWRLFNELRVKNYVINVDDCVGYRWLLSLSNAVAVTIKNNLPRSWSGRWIALVKADYYLYGTKIVFKSSWGNGFIHSQLLGEVNVSNILLALGALLIMGYSLKSLLYTGSKLYPVCGRLEVLSCLNHPTVIVDYAHTPDALKKILIFAKHLCNKGRLWCIFGCGGNRDRSKRSLMGVIANRYSDYVIITNDNPRVEDPKLIIDDIICKIRNSEKLKIIEDRVYAINMVVSKACSDDFVLILGKGHEKYQNIGLNYISHSDQDIVKSIFK
ncbi:UDP-N-acetylmuramoylalanyl-D-glutamate--2, 6-diaminopimelate ligase [Candidatus Blochmanniella floridana]|uniref:UDP-N-acetylmuramoyl-L-alanyl-D-glutamate--2,6-diaminopimelate ligase n=1 Tax=Blochmanniella floridana TaxID=203907 RepID=MURE_BLOFL|nr:RecName: Full=UDP-N-acetylmuramoyl-L-alanyl-D-glutamate--2,6-diaminopimelate ligase; AltName: Full=Meso-A2pm-adding enzyme; AltName: Full=Meso-diaminopimelate-adding enzyme; AltName: Full=UDP-MurNAc-L-Ala-D-Glu:meso-diaminopimelate ligase; AltName: Full=UDP-MurNAc-tripeptide synthetase; AltName: Full=UDP-N-acetylmuramyl-tripeptide synthetase [Candidatus Blochmannia floridanus]CAD83658.1 UDP-N-acetylmuramoylalanyl-D-glutamate--2, 6-diaminopimelate ligase [Candidatus Blochmannia floridanus]